MKSCRVLGVMFVASAVLVTWPLLVIGQEPAQKSGTTGQEMKQSSDTSKGTMETYKKDFKKELKEFDKKIARLGKKVKKEGSKAGAEAKESWNDLKMKRTAAKDKLKGLSSTAWEKTKAEADSARDELRKAYDKTASYFK